MDYEAGRRHLRRLRTTFAMAAWVRLRKSAYSWCSSALFRITYAHARQLRLPLRYRLLNRKHYRSLYLPVDWKLEGVELLPQRLLRAYAARWSGWMVLTSCLTTLLISGCSVPPVLSSGVHHYLTTFHTVPQRSLTLNLGGEFQQWAIAKQWELQSDPNKVITLPNPPRRLSLSEYLAVTRQRVEKSCIVDDFVSVKAHFRRLSGSVNGPDLNFAASANMQSIRYLVPLSGLHVVSGREIAFFETVASQEGRTFNASRHTVQTGSTLDVKFTRTGQDSCVLEGMFEMASQVGDSTSREQIALPFSVPLKGKDTVSVGTIAIASASAALNLKGWIGIPVLVGDRVELSLSLE